MPVKWDPKQLPWQQAKLDRVSFPSASPPNGSSTALANLFSDFGRSPFVEVLQGCSRKGNVLKLACKILLSFLEAFYDPVHRQYNNIPRDFQNWEVALRKYFLLASIVKIRNNDINKVSSLKNVSEWMCTQTFEDMYIHHSAVLVRYMGLVVASCWVYGNRVANLLLAMYVLVSRSTIHTNWQLSSLLK